MYKNVILIAFLFEIFTTSINTGKSSRNQQSDISPLSPLTLVVKVQQQPWKMEVLR